MCKLSQTELDSAMSANEYIKEYAPHMDYKDTPDLIYMPDQSDTYEAIETITRNYKGEEIERKVEWVRKAGLGGVYLNDIDGNRGGFR